VQPLDRRVDLGKLPRHSRRVRRVELRLHRVRAAIGWMRWHHGQISGTVLLVAIGVVADREIERTERAGPFLLETAREMTALLLSERHRGLLRRIAMHICGRDAARPVLTNSRAFARFVR